MKRIIIVGPSGAGKSYLSNVLKDILNIPRYHLDKIWWNKDKTHITRDEFDIRLKELLDQEEWIIDGDYSRTYQIRMEASDTIIFLDYPLEECLKGVKHRIGKVREDIPWTEDEFDPEFKQWIIDWFSKTRPKLLELLEEYKDTKQIIILHNRNEEDEFINGSFYKFSY